MSLAVSSPAKVGRSSIAEELMINREAAAYWIPAFAGMTAGPTTNASCLRMRAQAIVTRRVTAREGGRSSIAEELMINRHGRTLPPERIGVLSRCRLGR